MRRLAVCLALAACSPGSLADDVYVTGGAGAGRLEDARGTSTASGANYGRTLFPGVLAAGGDSTEPVTRYETTSSPGFSFWLAGGMTLPGRLRAEVSLDTRTNDYDSITVTQGFGAENGASAPADGSANSLTLSASLWHDVWTWGRWTPYIGGGVGLTRSDSELSVRGQPSIYGSDSTASWLLGAGIGYRLPSDLILSLDYRYIDAGDVEYDTVLNPVTTEYVTHSLSVGLRFGMDGPEYGGRTEVAPAPVAPAPPVPPVEAAPVVVTPPEVVPAQAAPADASTPDVPAVAVAPVPAASPDVAATSPVPEDVAAAPAEVTPPAPAAVAIELPPGVPDTVRFRINSVVLGDAARTALRAVPAALVAAPALELVIEGHCSDEGTNAYNMALSERRAKAVKDFLVQEGAPAEQIRLEAWGEERPQVPNTNEATRSQNRRVALRLEVREPPAPVGGPEPVPVEAPEPVEATEPVPVEAKEPAEPVGAPAQPQPAEPQPAGTAPPP